MRASAPRDASCALRPSADPAPPAFAAGFAAFAPSQGAGRETAAVLAARRALMSRKGVLPEEMDRIAGARRRQALRIAWPVRFRRGLGVAGWAAAGGGISWAGSYHASQPLLLCGYLVVAAAAVRGCAILTRSPSSHPPPLSSYYLRDECVADAVDIACLTRLARQDAEIEIFTAAWWRSPAPIRKGDLALALQLQSAKQAAARPNDRL